MVNAGVSRLLFICTHNRCRSQMYQAIANQEFGNVIRAESAGSQPEGQVNAGALSALQRHGIDTGGLYNKSWNDVADFNPDVIITVCDSAAGETCPLWFGATEKLHWPTPDPSAMSGTDEQKIAEFDRVVDIIRGRLADWCDSR